MLAILHDVQAQEVLDLVLGLAYFLAHVAVTHNQELELLGGHWLPTFQLILEKMR